ncbi:MAG: GNAT family N-acetyltransferase [Nibricoccus sp.]
MNLVPLMPDTLVETQQLAAELFPWEHEHQVALAAAVAPASHADFYRHHHLSSLQIWTTLKAGRVVGLASLYNYVGQPEETWLAWYGLHPSARGKGEGLALLDSVIEQAKTEHKHVLRLWTTDEPEYQKAISLYTSHGFHREPWPALPGETWHTQVFSLGLDGHAAAPLALMHPNAELCGREAPQLVAA